MNWEHYWKSIIMMWRWRQWNHGLDRTADFSGIFSITLACGYSGRYYHSAIHREMVRKTIRKPSWNPPNWLFGPVWASLYILMGVALWLVLSSIHWNSPQAEVPILLFVVQLFFNFLWSAIFFGLRRIGLALAEIILLWVSILLNLLEFYAINPLAGLLLIPYLAWVSLASCLNASVWWLNR